MLFPFQKILQFLFSSVTFHLPLPQLSHIRFQTLVTVSCCVNPICLPSLFKTIKAVFYFPNKLLGKMRSFGNGIKSNVMWKTSCVQFRCPLGTHFTVTPFISGNLLQTYPDLRERTFLSILWGFGKRDQKQVMWLFKIL